MGHWEGSYQGGRESCQENFPRGAVTGHRRGLLFLDRDIRSLSKGFDSEHVSCHGPGEELIFKCLLKLC